MKRYNFKNGTILIRFKKEIFFNIFNEKIQFVATHKYNGDDIFYTAKEAFQFIRNNQLTLNF